MPSTRKSSISALPRFKTTETNYNVFKIIDRLVKSDFTVLFLIFLLIFLMRLPWVKSLVIDVDEGYYLTLAQDMITGGIPYKTSWGWGPMLFFLFVPVIKIFGNNIIPIRLFTTACLLLSMYFTYLISRRFFNGKISLFPPLIYGLFFTEATFGGLASNGELFMMLPIIIAAFCLILYTEKEKFPLLLFCGLFSAVAILIKGSAFFTILAFPIFLFFRRFPLTGNEVFLIGKEILWFSIGGLFIATIFLAYFAYQGVLYDFFITFFIISNKYVAAISVSNGLQNLYDFIRGVVILNKDIISLLAFGSLLFILFSKRSYIQEKRITVFVILITILSFVGVFWGRRMFFHYYLQMGLSFSLLIGLGLNLIDLKDGHLKKIIYITLLLLFLSLPYSRTRSVLGDLSTRENHIDYEISDYIKENSDEKDQIFVLTGDPILYFLSHRKAPTKYFWGYLHGPRMDAILDIKKETMNVLNKNKPRYVIYDTNRREVAAEHLLKFTHDNYKPLPEKFGTHVIFEIKNNSRQR